MDKGRKKGIKKRIHLERRVRLVFREVPPLGRIEELTGPIRHLIPTVLYRSFRDYSYSHYFIKVKRDPYLSTSRAPPRSRFSVSPSSNGRGVLVSGNVSISGVFETGVPQDVIRPQSVVSIFYSSSQFSQHLTDRDPLNWTQVICPGSWCHLISYQVLMCLQVPPDTSPVL